MHLRMLGLLTLLVLAGCTALPEELQVPAETPLVSYRAVAADPEAQVDKSARWGGVIAAVQNLPEATLVEVVHFPLKSYGRPIVGDESIGRFRVYLDGFMDPVVYQEGRLITFAGKVLGVEEGNVGEAAYTFPTLKGEASHLWKDIQRVEITGLYIWPHPFYHPFNYHSWYYRPYYMRGTVRGTIRGQSGAGNSAQQPSSTNRLPVRRVNTTSSGGKLIKDQN